MKPLVNDVRMLEATERDGKTCICCPASADLLVKNKHCEYYSCFTHLWDSWPLLSKNWGTDDRKEYKYSSNQSGVLKMLSGECPKVVTVQLVTPSEKLAHPGCSYRVIEQSSMRGAFVVEEDLQVCLAQPYLLGTAPATILVLFDSGLGDVLNYKGYLGKEHIDD